MTEDTTAASAAEPETDAAGTLADIDASALAWLQTEPDPVVAFGRSWRRAAVTATVILAAAGAVAAGVVVLWPHHHQAAPAPQAAPRPSAAPALLPAAPAPPQTVTVQVPAPTPTPEPTPVLTDTDRQFLGALRKEGIEYPYSNPGYPIGKAHAVCDYESTHQQVPWGVDRSAQGGKFVEENTIWYGSNAVAFSSLAQQTYCPQYLDGEY